MHYGPEIFSLYDMDIATYFQWVIHPYIVSCLLCEIPRKLKYY
jgi:hypothetical protein